MTRLLLALMLCGCSAVADDPRAAFLRTTLVEDNRPWLDRDPDQVAQKLEKMSTRVYDYFRGTAGQFWRDVTEPGGPVDATTAFGDGPSSLVWLVGDPHLENLGTFRGADGSMRVDWNDLDASAAGPWWDDLRRLGVAWWIAAGDRDGLDADALVREAVAGYVEEIAALAAGEPGLRLRAEDGAIVADAIAHAIEDGDTGARLAEYTEVADGRRRMRFGDVEPRRRDGVYEDTLVPIDAAARARVEAAIADWRTHGELPDAAIVDAGQRLGAGVASFALLRYYVLLADDTLLEVRECGDGLRIPALPRFPDVGAPSNGERVVASARALGEDGGDDVLLGWGDVAPLSFKVQARSGYQRGLVMDEIVRWPADDVRALARQTGALLGRAHGDAPTAAGARGADVIAPRVSGREAELADETATFAAAYAVVVHDDLVTFQHLLATEGRLL